MGSLKGTLRYVLNGLDSSKFSEILDSNAGLVDKFPVHQIKIAFVRKPFLAGCKRHAQPSGFCNFKF